MNTHYVYRITNKVLNKHYYGVRTCSGLPVDDIGIKYFSSSSDKEFKLDQVNNKYKYKYKYKVIYIFKSRKEAVELEIKLHNKFNVGVNESFYNRGRQTSSGWDNTGNKHSDKTKQKMRESRLGKTSPRKGVVLSDQTRAKLKLAHSKREKVKCQYCGFETTIPTNIIRWHGENCKEKL